MRRGASRRIVIVGGGVFGVGAALELARRGWQVRLVESGPVPNPVGSSTDISKAVRMDYGSDEWHTSLAERAIAGWRAWNARHRETLYEEVGFLLLSRQSLEAGGFEAESLALLRRRGHAPLRLGAAELARRFPAWERAGHVDGYFNPVGGFARSARVVELLAAEAREAGAELSLATRCLRLHERGSRVAGVETAGGERLLAPTVLVAAGAWTPHLVPLLATVMGPTAQPVLYFRPADPRPFEPRVFPVWGADISRTGWYGFPLERGRVKIGNHGPGERLDPDAPRQVAESTVERFRAFLRESLPSLSDAPLVESRICLYCDTADGDFWIDRDPERPELVVAAGGSGHAFKFAPLLGRLVADVVEGRPNPDASRYAWRRPGADHREQARHLGSRETPG